MRNEVKVNCPGCNAEVIVMMTLPQVVVAPNTILMLIEHSGMVTCTCGAVSAVQISPPAALAVSLKPVGRSQESRIIVPN